MEKNNKQEWRKHIKFACIWILSVMLAAAGMTAGFSYAYLGDPGGFLKIVRTLHLIEYYYAGDTQKQELLNGALEGMVAKLGDRHSMYLDGEAFSDFTNQMTGSFAGIGVYISTCEEGALINGIIDDSPAQEQGLQRGDVILAVDGKPAAGMKLEDISRAVRGPEGSAVAVVIRRSGADTTYSLERRRIHVPTVMGEIADGTDIGYLRIALFSENTGEEFTKKYNELKEKGMKKMILDLRDNPGGLVDQATHVASNFVPPGSTIMSYTDSTGREQSYVAPGTEDIIPIVVLINENSASASEIIAGDVQDLKLGTIVGVTSYGKGTVQGVYSIGDDNALKLTVAKYKTAAGRTIDGTGITPDAVITLQPGDTEDYQLKKAMELLQNS